MSGYIGTQPVPQATQHRETFTATAGQTSFATAGYTPQFLDVFLNGIHLLNPEDYTATNGSDVVLTTGAALDDVLEVISYSPFEVADQTFTGTTSTDNLSVTGSFTSKGIDDNATSTAMTLDASGNLLVGKTSTSFGTAGTAFGQSGQIAAVRSGNAVADLNRLSSDGAIVNFYKDGVSVGSVGARSGGLFIGGALGSDAYLFMGNNVIKAADNTGGGRHDAISLGDQYSSFKDLYLSGGVYLGGTGSANLLDDYEVGRFTPSMAATSVSYNQRQGDYVKIGKLVHVYIFLQWSSVSGWSGSVEGLPFPCSSLDTFYPMGSVFNNIGVSYPSGRSTVLAYINDNTTNMTLACVGSAVNAAAPVLSTSGYFHISLTYQTSA